MEEYRLLAPVLISLVLLNSCGVCNFTGSGENTYANEINEINTCETPECLDQNLDECQPSRLNISSSDVSITVEIKGPVKDSCKVYIRLDDINLKNNPSSLKALLPFIRGSDMNCYLTNEDLNYLRRISSSNVNYDKDERLQEILSNECEGSLASLIIEYEKI